MTKAAPQDPFRGMRVLVTGHTGFKGSWLCAWLQAAGADIAGLALPPESDRPSLYTDLALDRQMRSILADIRDLEMVKRCVRETAPAIIFHLAAQPLVRRSYADPIGTLATNVMGTAHVLEAARGQPSVRAIVCVTSDKCYDNHETPRGYRETDPLGGTDPYSASKAAAELVVRSYRDSLYALGPSLRLATARGGNVIGGGDWSEDRLVPDLARALAAGKPLTLRNPLAVRPWQHVLELIHGYCMLGARLLDDDPAAEAAWNFGPRTDNEVTVRELVDRFVGHWAQRAAVEIRVEESPLRETRFLKLDITKAETELGWHPRFSFDETVAMTAAWYGRYRDDPPAAATLARAQLAAYRRAIGYT
jgi:CDP-glucose 4,6-dehydratase